MASAEPPERRPPTFRRPSVDDFVFEGEGTPRLLRRRVLAAVVAAFAVLTGGYVLLAELTGLSYQVDAEPFREWVERRGAWGPVVFILVMALSVLFAPIPNLPIFIAAGLAWGWLLGSAYSMAGLLLGSTLAFYTARLLGRRHLARLVGGRAAQRLDALAESMGGRLIFWARMLPIINFDWISYVAGLTSIRFWPFFVFSFLGMLLPTAVAVAAGDALGRDFRITLAITAGWVAAIVASALFFWWRRRRWRAAPR